MKRLLTTLVLVLALPLPALAASEDAAPATAPAAPWAFETSDIPVDPAYRFGRLPNGLRYIIRHNSRPAGTGIVRLRIGTGSLDESDDERGLAHFLEHMAFKGSTNVPAGEMVHLLERKGLAFGADTNASTSFDETIYKLDLPNSDPDLLDTALMLMRETASELSIAPDAVATERGVILSEMRDRNTWQLRNYADANLLFYPDALFSQRLPIGTRETVAGATAERLRAFYAREYRPSQATLIVIGDFDVALVEKMIRARFVDWTGAPAEPQPEAGPVLPNRRIRSEIYIDPAVSERVTVLRSGPWLDEPDSVAQRREGLLRGIGYGIVNRRLQSLSRSDDPPFRGAGFGTGDVFEAARSTRLIVDTVDGEWKRGLESMAREYRRALALGFTESEVAEQVAQLRSALENAAASAETRTNSALAGAALALIDDGTVPSTPASALERFEAMEADIDPRSVLAALNREALDLARPMIRFEGRNEPEGGAAALRKAWRKGVATRFDARQAAPPAQWSYTDFGTPGTVVADTRESALGIREVRFANGVRLNLKPTEIEKGKVRIKVSIDGGDRLNTRDNPLATQMMAWFDDGGLARHSVDSLQSIFAGRTVSAAFGAVDDSFVTGTVTTPADLRLELELLAAYVTDPGYRREGEVRYRQQINDWFAKKDASPASAMGAALGAILTDNDPRFSLQPIADYRALGYGDLRDAISGRLARGAVEIGIVGDIAEDDAIAWVAATFGALPPRETEFGDAAALPARTFTEDRSRRVVRHTGPEDQALIRYVWPTRDDSDADEAMALSLLERVVRLKLTEGLRERLGKAYSPSASSSLSRFWPDYGTFAIQASVDVADVSAVENAIDAVVRDLMQDAVDADTLERARKPLLEDLANALKSNQGWLSLVDRAQTQPDRISRYLAADARLRKLDVEAVRSLARRYLAPDRAVEVLTLPTQAQLPPDMSRNIMDNPAATR